MKRTLFAPLIAAVVLSALVLTGCGEEDSGAYDQGMEALEAGDYDTAMDLFLRAAQEDGREAESYRAQGILYMKKEDYTHALTLFDMSLEAMAHRNDDFREDVEFYQADALMHLEKYSEAEQILDDILLDGKQTTKAYVMLGQIALMQEDFSHAKECFQKAAQEDFHCSMGLAIYRQYSAMGREADGAVYLEKALAFQAETAEEWFARGEIYCELEEYDAAQESLGKAIELGSSEAVLLKGRIYLETDNPEAARNLFKEYLNSGADPAAAYNGLALCDMAVGSYASALVQVENGLNVAEEGEKKSLLYNEVVAYEKLLDFDTAFEKLEQYLKVYPEDQEAFREYKFLLNRKS